MLSIFNTGGAKKPSPAADVMIALFDIIAADKPLLLQPGEIVPHQTGIGSTIDLAGQLRRRKATWVLFQNRQNDPRPPFIVTNHCLPHFSYSYRQKSTTQRSGKGYDSINFDSPAKGRLGMFPKRLPRPSQTDQDALTVRVGRSIQGNGYGLGEAFRIVAAENAINALLS
jgi:hypothetical protein